jgi:hypothetical protein
MSITKGYTRSTACSEAIAVLGKVILYNFEDWGACTITRADDDSPITGIVNATGKAGFMFELPVPSIKPSTPASVSENYGGLTHTLNLTIPTVDQELKNTFVKALDRNRLVALTLTTSKTAPVQVYGSCVGLMASAFDIILSDSAQAGGINVTLSTPSFGGSLEREAPVNVLDTDYETTLALFNGLTTPGA